MRLKIHTKKMIYIAIGIVLFLILYALKNTSYFLRSFNFIFSIFLFSLGDYFFKFRFKKRHYIILILISMVAILFSPLYFIAPNFDKTLHLINPILLSILVFFLVNKIDIRFSTKLMITFSFMISILALFEIGEYIVDQFFNYKLQGVFVRDLAGLNKLKIIMDRNDDTMIDLILGTIGSLTFAGYKTIEFHYKRLVLKKE